MSSVAFSEAGSCGVLGKDFFSATTSCSLSDAADPRFPFTERPREPSSLEWSLWPGSLGDRSVASGGTASDSSLASCTQAGRKIISRTDSKMTLPPLTMSLKIGSFWYFSQSSVSLIFEISSLLLDFSKYLDLQRPLSPRAGASKGAKASATTKLVGNGRPTRVGFGPPI